MRADRRRADGGQLVTRLPASGLLAYGDVGP